MNTYHPLLWDWQVEALAKGLPVLQHSPLHGFYLAHGVGTGKTVTGIAFARLLQAQITLVVTTVNGVAVWDNHLAKWWPEADVRVLYGGHWQLDGRAVRWTSASKPIVLVTSWEQLVNVDESERRIRMFRRLHPDLLVLDESHKAKAATSDLSRMAWKLEQDSTYRLRMSGTAQHNYLDLWAQYRYICPDPLFQGRYRDYKEAIAVWGGPDGTWRKGWRAETIDRIGQLIAPYTHTADAAVLKIPDPVTSVIPVRLSPDERRIYDEMEQKSYVELSRGESRASIVLARALRLQQITSGHLPAEEWDDDRQALDKWTEEIGSAKIDAVLEEIDKRPARKILVGCRFIPEMMRLGEEMKKRGRLWATIRGATGQAARARIEEFFQDTDQPVVLLIQFATATAITLTAAETVMLVSVDPKVINFGQFMGRAYRGGQTKTLEVLAFCAENTIDEDLFASVQADADEMRLSQLLLRGMQARQQASV